MSISYRPYREGDETAIVDLYREVFQIPYEESRWRWQYAQTPEALRREILLAFDGPRLVGHASAVPLRLSSSLGTLSASHSQDGFVRREYRGAGLYSELLRRLEDIQRAHGVDIVIGHPNPLSISPMKGIGYEHLFDLYPYSLDLDSLAGPFPTSASVAVSEDGSFTDGDSRFLETQLSHYGIRGTRSREWLEWRYHPGTGKRYRVVRAHDDGALVAVAVVKEYPQGGCIDLLEFVALDDEALIRAVLETIARAYRESGLGRASLWSMEHFRLHARLVDIGFRREDRRTHFVARALTSLPDLEWREPSLYYLSMADSDIY